MLKIAKSKQFIFFILCVVLLLVFYFLTPLITKTDFIVKTIEFTQPKPIITHIITPVPVKGIYMSACVASTPSFREKLVNIAKSTEINSIVIDVKDYTGTISFESDNIIFSGNKNATGCKVKDMKDFLAELHKNNIYVIARITAFQDPFIAKANPEWAVKKYSDKNILWKDRKGVNYIDVGAKPFWDYLLALGKESYAIGFDEINYDYIRFPSDGDMRDIYFPWSEERIMADTKLGKSQVLKEFFEFIGSGLKNENIPISADLFGMTTTNPDDLNIGQILEDALPNFDFVCPMVYPSHYPSGFLNLSNPAEKPYEVVNYSLSMAAGRAKIASTTPFKIRPWLQDFDLGATYTPERVRKQIQATYDAGLDSWLLWDAGNTYTIEALLSKNETVNN